MGNSFCNEVLSHRALWSNPPFVLGNETAEGDGGRRGGGLARSKMERWKKEGGVRLNRGNVNAIHTPASGAAATADADDVWN